MKQLWRKILSQWKQKVRNRQLTLPKDKFPALLATLWEELKKNGAENLRAGFRACGIHPLNAKAVLINLPGGEGPEEEDEVYRCISQSLLDFLKEERCGEGNACTRNKRISVSPGMSVSDAGHQDNDNLQKRK